MLETKTTRVEALAAAQALWRELERVGFSGWDPYDALSSRAVRAVARGRMGRLIAVQGLKRSPVNLRPLLGVPRRRHTKALALLVSGRVLLEGSLGDDRSSAVAAPLARELAARAIRRDDGVGFAYDFDVQTRWGYYRAGTPNAVVTSFAAHALLDGDALLGGSGEDLARSTLDYASARLLRAGDRDGRYYAYFEGSSVPIHNASLLVASVAARCVARDSTQGQEAELAVRYTLDRQRPDGSWPYGEHPQLGWIDGYHTAYVLEALWRWNRETGDEEVLPALERGLRFYLDHLVDADGAARATATSRFPIDIHSASSGIRMLSLLAAFDARAFPTARRMLEWTLAHMRRRDGRFAFQRTRFYRTSIPYLRWSDAHMLLALATYLEAESRGGR